MMRSHRDLVFYGVPLSSSSLFVYGKQMHDRQSRGQGILEGLFGITKESLGADYDVGIAFVSQSNPRSLLAHTAKLGMRVVDEFEFDAGRYSTPAFSVRWGFLPLVKIANR